MTFPGRRRQNSTVKKLLFISIAVVALLVLALGGWAAKTMRRTPAYA